MLKEFIFSLSAPAQGEGKKQKNESGRLKQYSAIVRYDPANRSNP